LNGIQEVNGSIPSISTKRKIRTLCRAACGSDFFVSKGSMQEGRLARGRFRCGRRKKGAGNFFVEKENLYRFFNATVL
jgi:hypothetical protein